MTWAQERLNALKAGEAAVPPVVETLRLGTLDDWGPGWVTKRWQSDPALLNGDGSMFGGYTAALADQILALAALTVLPDNATMRTVHLSLQFVRIGRGEPLCIEGKVIAQSRSLITVACEIKTERAVLIATATAQQMVLYGALTQS